MRRSMAHRAAVALAAAATALLMGAASASAWSNSYCGVLMSSGTWCGDGSNHSYDFNSATYNGGGTVWLCQRLLIADTSTERAAPTCAYNYVAQTFPAYPWLTEAEINHYSGGANHTIYGYATA